MQDLSSRREQFIKAMDDDLNTADALAAVFDLVRDININILNENSSQELCQFAIDLFDELCGVLGLVYNRKSQSIDDKMKSLLQKK